MTPKDIQGVLRQFFSRIPPEEREGIIVFGSAAIILNGVPISPGASDLDLFVSDRTFSRLEGNFVRHFKKATEGGEIPFLVHPDVPSAEIFRSFPGVTYSGVHARAQKRPMSEGLLVGALEDLRSWKLAHGRDKDILCAELITRHVSIGSLSESGQGACAPRPQSAYDVISSALSGYDLC